MRLLAATTAVAATLLAGAGAAPAADIGANDDTAKHMDDRGATVFREMAGPGLRQTVIAVRFKPSEAVVIQDKALLDAVIPNAIKAGSASCSPSIHTRRASSRPVSGRRRSSAPT